MKGLGTISIGRGRVRPPKRTVRQWSGVGDGVATSKMDLAELVRAIPTLLIFDILPPQRVLNAVLQQGVSEAGMSGRCEWRPFRISATEFRALVSDMEKLDEGFRYIEPPAHIRSPDDWRCWAMSHVMGIPLAQHLRLSRKVGEWSAKEAIAKKKGDVAGAAKAGEKVGYWFGQQFELMRPYVEAHHKK